MTTQVPNSMLAVTPAADSAVVHNTGDETIAGTKTFSSQPVLPQKLTQGTAVASTSGGTISLAGALDNVRLTTVNGTDTFDAGSINILYE